MKEAGAYIAADAAAYGAVAEPELDRKICGRGGEGQAFVWSGGNRSADAGKGSGGDAVRIWPLKSGLVMLVEGLAYGPLVSGPLTALKIAVTTSVSSSVLFEVKLSGDTGIPLATPWKELLHTVPPEFGWNVPPLTRLTN